MKKLLATALLILLLGGVISAQQSQEELSEAAENPLADVISLPFQNNLNMNYGECKRNFFSQQICSKNQRKLMNQKTH